MTDKQAPRSHYAKRYKDPEFREKELQRANKRRAKLLADPEALAKRREYDRRYREQHAEALRERRRLALEERKARYHSDPEFREQMKQASRTRQREAYARKRAAEGRVVGEPRVARTGPRLTPEEREASLRRKREAKAAREREQRRLARQEREAARAAELARNPPPPPPPPRPRAKPRFGGIIARIIWHGGSL